MRVTGPQLLVEREDSWVPWGSEERSLPTRDPYDIGSAIDKLDKHSKGGEQEEEELQHLGHGRNG